MSAAAFSLHAGLAALLWLGTGSPPPAPFRDAGGLSGRLRAVILDEETLSELNRGGLNLSIEGPGAHRFEWPARWPAWRPEPGLSVILLTPFSAKVNGLIGPYTVGTWPNENAASGRGKAALYAAKNAAYALPRGFIEVTKATAPAFVSEHFRLGDFLTHGQPAVWPKFLVLDMKLVDKLELVIDALGAAGHPVKGLHVMSGFRTPAYNGLDIGPDSRSEISRHIYGDAADVYPDDDGDGRLDDLNGDRHVDLADARIVADAAESVERKFPALAGGIAVYAATSAHGPFVHLDTRGRRARWGK